MTPTIIALALALAPIDRAPAAFDVADVEVVTGADAVYISTFDEDGDQSAAVVVWFGPQGQQHVDVDFADGLYLSITFDDDGEPMVTSNDHGEVAARMTAIGDFIAIEKPPLESRELWCLGSVVAAGSCLVGNMLGCIPASIAVACNCLPLVGDYPPGCGY
jgi:hypothetical protein